MLRKKASVICAVVLITIITTVCNITAPEIMTANSNITVTQNNGYSQYSSKNIGWGFKKEKGKLPDMPSDVYKLFSETNTYFSGKKEKVMYLTFDEGYENGYTAQILDVLKDKGVSAAFFITGHYFKSQGELVERMEKEGHIVGNHSLNHPNLAKSDLSTVSSELDGLNTLYASKFNKNMKFFRPPEGEYSEKLLHYVSDMGYTTVFWSFAYRDWEANNIKGADYAFNQIVPYFHDGAIILLHAVSKDNADALSRVIDEALNEGYSFKSLTELN